MAKIASTKLFIWVKPLPAATNTNGCDLKLGKMRLFKKHSPCGKVALTITESFKKRTMSLALSVWLAICRDRKSTRLNSSHVRISYAVFCLKKKKKNQSIKI